MQYYVKQFQHYTTVHPSALKTVVKDFSKAHYYLLKCCKCSDVRCNRLGFIPPSILRALQQLNAQCKYSASQCSLLNLSVYR